MARVQRQASAIDDQLHGRSLPCGLSHWGVRIEVASPLPQVRLDRVRVQLDAQSRRDRFGGHRSFIEVSAPVAIHHCHRALERAGEDGAALTFGR
jgi:hypothetical protein